MARTTTMPKDAEKIMLEMVLRGATNKTIAQYLGRSLTSVVYWRRKLNINTSLSMDFIQFRLKSLDK